MVSNREISEWRRKRLSYSERLKVEEEVELILQQFKNKLDNMNKIFVK